MVLHNNKWDRRAKHKYLKKHGLSASDLNRADKPAQIPHAAEQDDEAGARSEAENEPESSELEAADSPEEGVMITPDLPELDELDPELQRLFRQRALNAQKPVEKAHTIGVADASEIQRATAGVERSKMNKAVREKFGSRVAAKLRQTPLELDSDSDFDEFMDELDNEEPSSETQLQKQEREAGGKIAVNQDKQEFLDKLFR